MAVGVWDRARADDLAALLGESFPDDALTYDEIVACCFEDDGAVLALDDGDGAAALVVRGTQGFVKALAVAPRARRERRGRALVDAAEEWLFDRGCESVIPGPSAPFYLWPGIDVRWTRAMAMFESAGYAPVGANLNMSFPSTFRAAPPDGIDVRRILDPADVEATMTLCAQHWPEWVPETRRGVEQGAAFAAVETASGAVVGFVCHSVNRTAWLGPMATDPSRQRGGVGSALLSAVAADVGDLGRPDVEVAWVGPVRFYAKAAGAAVSRTFRVVLKRRASGRESRGSR